MTDFIRAQAETWNHIYNRWHRLKDPEYPFDETPNGPGSRTDTTLAVRTWLPQLITKYGIHTILDAPCGDWTWMSYLHRHYIEAHINYTGYDNNPDTIKLNRKAWPQHNFEHVNLLTVDKLPKVDLIICRDLMIHLPNEYIEELLDKILLSGSRYLLATNNPGADNFEHPTPEDGGDCNLLAYYDRRVNLESDPFNMAPPVDAIPEANDWSDDRTWDDKQLALFQL